MASAAAQKPRSVFDLPPDFFDSCRLLDPSDSSAPPPPPSAAEAEIAGAEAGPAEAESRGAGPRLTCNTCKAEFESLQDQRDHFKSDVHRLNVKLSIAGKNTIKEDDFDELGGDSLFEDNDVSSISGSEDEFDKGSMPNSGISGKTREGIKQKLYFHLPSGDIVSVWRCFIFDESEELPENNELVKMGVGMSHVEGQLINRLKGLVREPRDKTQLRVVLLASGGHFAGCVFDGNSIVAHKTFHRYVVRAKAGKQQSAHDAGGKVAHSAGSSLRRYNEGALKKEIQELLVTWKPYIDSSSCIFVYAPSRNRHILFDRERPPSCAVRTVPFLVRRPTLKEAKRVYHHLTHISYEVWGKNLEEDLPLPNERKGSKLSTEARLDKHVGVEERASAFGSVAKCLPSNGDNVTLESLSTCEEMSLSQTENELTPLHEAAKSGDTQRILELLEQGTNPCTKDSRGRTPYMLATEKEVRNTFRRFMALNLDKWDWHAANVPSPLTKEMEDSQAAKQSEKDAKRKAKAKELKKLRKANEKAKAQEAASQSASAAIPRVQQAAAPTSSLKQRPPLGRATVSKEEEERHARAAEREMRAAAAERRMAALNPRMATTLVATPPELAAAPSSSGSGATDGCTCCNVSLAGKVPFHRYNYRYCSTSCMYVHKQMLEDE